MGACSGLLLLERRPARVRSSARRQEEDEEGKDNGDNPFPFFLPSLSRALQRLLVLLGPLLGAQPGRGRASALFEEEEEDDEEESKTTTTTTATTTANGKEKEEKVETELELEDRGYKLPTSPLFALVACPNYAAECAEWLSFAAASLFASRAAAGEGSGRKSAVVLGEALPSLAFALFTAANLVPRALAHRRWYLEKFEDFPRGKKAIVPWVL